METRDLIEKTIEDMSKALMHLLKVDVNEKPEDFIRAFDEMMPDNSGANDNLLLYLDKIDNLISTDMLLILYKTAVAYHKMGDKQQANYYSTLASGLESKPRTISYHDQTKLTEIDELKNILNV